MSAMLIMAALVIPVGQTPDFDAARSALANLRRADIVRRIEDQTGWDLLSDDGEGSASDSDIDFARRGLAAARPYALQSLQSVQDAWNGDDTTAGILTVMGYTVLVGGETSYGDSPDIVTAIGNFAALDLDLAAGFVRNPPTQ